MSRRTYLTALLAILLAAFAVRMITWSELRNMIWPDEIFNSLEQSHRLAFGYGIMPWEWRDGIRSWLLPGLLAGAMAATSLFTSSVTAYLAACAGVLSAISLVPVWATFRTAMQGYGLRAALVAAWVLVIWFEAVYFAPKALTEVAGGNCLAVGVLLADRCSRSQRSESPVHVHAVIVTAIFLALATVLRVQLAIASLVAFVFLLWRIPVRQRWFAVAGALGIGLFAGLLDAVTWSYPFSSYIENVRVNVLVGKSSEYGVAPWYAYFEVYARIWGPWGLLVLGLAALGARARPLLAVCVAAVLLTHVPIAHKEYRFMYPAMLLVLILAGFGSAMVVSWLERRQSVRMATLSAIAIASIWLGASFQLSNGFHEEKTQLAKTYSRPAWHWELHRGGLLAMRELNEDPTVCGVGLIGMYVFITGGYTYLHRDIPIFETYRREDVAGLSPYVNVYLLAAKPELSEVPEFRGYERQRCIHEVCIYRRPGGCKVMPGYHYNEVLKARGS